SSSILFGCQQAKTADINNEIVADNVNVVITKQQDCANLTIDNGQYIQFELPSNPTTGYNWFVTKSTALFQQIGKAGYQATQYNKPRVGSGGNTIYQFQAINTGTDNIVFSYLRPWEKG